jgi:hypothetical protein
MQARSMHCCLPTAEAIDVNQHCALTSASTRIAIRIGLDRVGKDSMTLDTYRRF